MIFHILSFIIVFGTAASGGIVFFMMLFSSNKTLKDLNDN